MKVQKIGQPASIEALESWGNVEGLPDTPAVKLSGLQKVIPGKEDIESGGSGSFTPDGEATLTFTAGDSFFFEANTEGTWVVETTMRKLYVIFDAA
jgi:bacillopeptidase F (M6 metalloprotease family)